MRWCKYGKMGFLKSRNANKHVLLALVDRTARDAVKAKFTRLSSMSPLYMSIPLRSIAMPRKTLANADRACH